MGDVVHEATEVIVPLLAGGASDATKILAEYCGERLAQAFGRVFAKLRRTGGGGVDGGEVEQTLRAALARGELQESDLRTLVQNRTTIIGKIEAKNVFVNSDIDIHGSFNA
jgi:hypothetical protein